MSNDTGKQLIYKNKSIVLAGTGGLNTRNNPYLYDDFLGDTLDTNHTAVNKDTGATNFAISVAANGMIRGACGATDDEKAEIAGEIIWLPSKGLVFETRLKVSAITTVAVVAGLSDAKNEGATLVAVQATGAGATLTTTASNGAYFLFDTDTSGASLKWLGVGVKADTDATTVNTGIAPVADTYNTLRIEIDASGNAIYKVLDDAQPWAAPLYQGFQANAVTASTLLCPYIAIQARTTASRNLDVDYWSVRQLAR